MQTAKNSAKQKSKINFGTNLPYLGTLCCKFEKLLSCLKSASSNLQKFKVLCNIKNT